jgi:hypothetical protein
MTEIDKISLFKYKIDRQLKKNKLDYSDFTYIKKFEINNKLLNKIVIFSKHKLDFLFNIIINFNNNYDININNTNSIQIIFDNYFYNNKIIYNEADYYEYVIFDFSKTKNNGIYPFINDYYLKFNNQINLYSNQINYLKYNFNDMINNEIFNFTDLYIKNNLFFNGDKFIINKYILICVYYDNTEILDELVININNHEKSIILDKFFNININDKNFYIFSFNDNINDLNSLQEFYKSNDLKIYNKLNKFNIYNEKCLNINIKHPYITFNNKNHYINCISIGDLAYIT